MSPIAEISALKKHPLVLYLLVGAINTLFGYSLYALLIFSGLNYLLAGVLSTALGVIFNYHSFAKLVFFNHNNVLLRFCLSYALLAVINCCLLKLGSMVFSDAYLLGLMALLPSAVISFLWNKTLVFSRMEHEID